jgi:ADP-heptose:LPS heptosyltransferase
MKLRRKRFSLLIDLEHNLIWHQIIHTRLINPKWVASSFKCDRYGVNTHTLTLYDVMAKVKPDNPMVEIYLGISEALGVPRVEGDERYQLVLSKENLAYAESYFNSESFFVGFNFFGSKKGWEISAEDFYKLCSEVFAIRPTLKVLVFATQENLPRIKDMVAAATLPFVRVVSPTSDVMDAAAIISKLDLVITPDTSFTHIVCAFDIPIVSINPKGDEVFQNWKPIHPSSRARVIFSKGAKSLKGYSYEELKSAVESYLPPISV